MTKNCCEELEQATVNCKQHHLAETCPDKVISYIPKFDEYGVLIQDGGTSMLTIKYCPWCGHQLPESRRDEWFDTLEKIGFDDPGEQDIPKEFTSDAWYRKP